MLTEEDDEEPIPFMVTDTVYSTAKKVPVFKNPSRKELEHVCQLDKEAKINSCHRSDDTYDWVHGTARGNVTHKGNVYIWPENDAEHNEIAREVRGGEGVAVGFTLRPGELPRVSGYSSHPYSKIADGYSDEGLEDSGLQKDLESEYNESLAPHGIKVQFENLPNDREPSISEYSSHPYSSILDQYGDDIDQFDEDSELRKQIENDYNEELAPHGVNVKVKDTVPNDNEIWERILTTNPHIRRLTS